MQFNLKSSDTMIPPKYREWHQRLIPRCDSAPFYCRLGRIPSICETPGLLRGLPSIPTRANADDGGWEMNGLSILGGLLLCTGPTEKKGAMMRGSKDDSSMTRYRFMEAAVTPMCGNNGRSVTSIFFFNQNTEILWSFGLFHTYGGKQVRLYCGLLTLQRLTMSFIMSARCFAVLKTTVERSVTKYTMNLRERPR